MCGLKADTRTCDYSYKPDQETIRFFCPICKDGTIMTPITVNKDAVSPSINKLKFVLKTVDNNNNNIYNITTMNGELSLDGLEKYDDGYRAKFKRDDGTICYGLVAGCFETGNGYELVIEIEFFHTSITVMPDNLEIYEIVKNIHTNFQKSDNKVNS